MVATGSWLLAALSLPGVSAAQAPFVNEPPPPGAVCPAIAEDYDLCSNDPFGGNCQDFVSAAGALGRLYLFNVEREPGRAAHFQTSVWWQCGSRNLSEIRALLARIDSPQARAVIGSEPYRSLPERPDPSRARHRSPGPTGCTLEQTDSGRSACEARELAALEAEHRSAFEACKKLLPEVLRSELVAQERSWRTDLEVECADPACLSEAIRRRDDTMRQAFPQCGAPG
jgi:hypothetical protein